MAEADEDTDSIQEQQNEEYLRLRAEGLSKEEAANAASPPGTTELRATESDD